MKNKETAPSEIRLNKHLADLGVSSRRGADLMIKEGRISVNGDVVTALGAKVWPKKDEISVDGIPIEQKKARKKEYYMFHKPRGVVTTMSDPEGRLCIKDFLKGADSRLFPVGRLDYDTEGLLVLTNDGDLTEKLLHPKYEKSKIYRVKVKGIPSHETLSKLRKGIKLEDGMFRPDKLVFEESAKRNSWYKMTVSEGRNRVIRRAWSRSGHHVVRLVRIKFAGLTLGPLKPGFVRPLMQDEIAHLKK